jgi:hypothetical protein
MRFFRLCKGQNAQGRNPAIPQFFQRFRFLGIAGAPDRFHRFAPPAVFPEPNPSGPTASPDFSVPFLPAGCRNPQAEKGRAKCLKIWNFPQFGWPNKNLVKQRKNW